MFILCNQRTNQESSAARRIFPLRRWRGSLRNYQHNNYKNTKFASLRFDFCSCSLVNVAKIRCRVLPSVVLYYFLPKDKRTSQDSRLLKSTVTDKSAKRSSKVRIWAERGIKNLAALIKSNKNFPVSERSEFRGNFYWLQRDACGFFAQATKSVNFCQPQEFSCFVLLFRQKNEDE